MARAGRPCAVPASWFSFPMADGAPTHHASCIAIGEAGVLIRGKSGSGKSCLALRLILDPPRALRPATLVADDRVRLAVRDGLLVATVPETLAGLIEVRHLGIRRLPHRPFAVVRLVVDLGVPEVERLPADDALRVVLEGVTVPRIAVPAGADAALLVAAALESEKF